MKMLNILLSINLLWDLDKHYGKKENLVFPCLKIVVSSFTSGNVGVDDEIRDIGAYKWLFLKKRLK